MDKAEARDECLRYLNESNDVSLLERGLVGNDLVCRIGDMRVVLSCIEGDTNFYRLSLESRAGQSETGITLATEECGNRILLPYETHPLARTYAECSARARDAQREKAALNDDKVLKEFSAMLSRK